MKVSFVIPVYNTGQYLQEAVSSIRQQAWGEVAYEMVLVDDCSSDVATVELLDVLKSEPAITVVRQPKNAGPAAARNTGIECASGDWVAFLDSDDRLMPEAMQRRLEVIRKFPNVQWIAGNILVLHDQNLPPDEREFFRKAADFGEQVMPRVVRVAEPTTALMQWPMVLQVGSVMVRRHLLTTEMRFDNSLRYGEDWYFWLLLGTKTDLYWIEDAIMCLRRHHESMMTDHLALALKVSRASKKALGDVRLVSISRRLRWKVASDYRWSSRLLRRERHFMMAFWAAVFSVLYVPNSLESWREVANSLLRK